MLKNLNIEKSLAKKFSRVHRINMKNFKVHYYRILCTLAFVLLPN